MQIGFRYHNVKGWKVPIFLDTLSMGQLILPTANNSRLFLYRKTTTNFKPLSIIKAIGVWGVAPLSGSKHSELRGGVNMRNIFYLHQLSSNVLYEATQK
jgi:hypothetical protein